MKFVLYQDHKLEYRWRLVSSNGRTIADSGEGYHNKVDCQAGIELVRQHAGWAPIQDNT